MNTDLYYRATLDSLTPTMLKVLIDMADSAVVSVTWTEKKWPYPALAARDLIGAELAQVEYVTSEHYYTLEMASYQLTAYGRDFLAWYRAPREVPGQLELF